MRSRAGRNPASSDRERPLNKRGRKACKLIGPALAEAGVRPDAVVVSPAARTQETWKRISGAIGGGAEVWNEEKIYGATEAGLIGLIAEMPEGIGELMLIGHNPGMGELAAMLAAGDERASEIRLKFPTGAVASFAVSCEWGRLLPAAATLERFLRPKDLG